MPNDSLKETEHLMGALLRMPPKRHEDMKLGKPRDPKQPKRKPKGKREGSGYRPLPLDCPHVPPGGPRLTGGGFLGARLTAATG